MPFSQIRSRMKGPNQKRVTLGPQTESESQIFGFPVVQYILNLWEEDTLSTKDTAAEFTSSSVCPSFGSFTVVHTEVQLNSESTENSAPYFVGAIRRVKVTNDKLYCSMLQCHDERGRIWRSVWLCITSQSSVKKPQEQRIWYQKKVFDEF